MIYKIGNFNLKGIQNLSTTVWNPISSISELPYHEAKRIMSEVYNHELTKEEYLLMPTAKSSLDFFKKIKVEEELVLQEERKP